MERSARPRNREPRRSPLPLGAALRALTEDLGIAGRLREYDVLTSWSALVGEQVARVAAPVRLENGVLVVHVASAPWRAELTMRRRDIMSRINEAAGHTVVREIRFR